MIKNLNDSIVWRKSYDLVLQIYKSTEDFPCRESYNLTTQIRRSALSVVSNIAEGIMRETKYEFGHFLAIAKGSAGELMTQIELAEDMHYMTKDQASRFKTDLMEIIKILFVISKKIRIKR